MPYSSTYLPYSDTGSFSHTVIDYLSGHANLQSFFKYSPDKEGLAKAIADRSQYPVDRKALVSLLEKQYANLEKSEKVSENIALLAMDNTYTVCTAHQPNLLTGYLYFIYKIVHAIKLADELKQQHPEHNFVPVYYMGSEDNDLDELGTFRYDGKKFVWDAEGQTGAVGRMDTKSLKKTLDELFKLLGPPGGNLDELKNILSTAYLHHKTIGAATQYLVNALFGKFGLIVIDPDEAEFKRAYIDVMRDELLHQSAYPIVSAQIEKLEAHYKAQAHPRPINLFYLKDNLRERIERRGDVWQVVNTDIEFTEAELMKELDEHPERFSPNVILRGMFQERILPDVAFIGGGAEVAYWLQLKSVFEHYNIFYPVVLLRQSIMWITQQQAKLQQQLGLSLGDIFKNDSLLVRQFISAHSKDDWQTAIEGKEIELVLERLKKKAMELDSTLRSSADAVLTKIRYQVQVLERKMLRAEKRKMQEQLLKITKLKNALFPNGGLQERVENFSEYFLRYGYEYFDVLYNAIEPLASKFLIIEQQD